MLLKHTSIVAVMFGKQKHCVQIEIDNYYVDMRYLLDATAPDPTVNKVLIQDRFNLAKCCWFFTEYTIKCESVVSYNFVYN